MCGIGGIIFKNNGTNDFSKFKQSFDLSAHRGPDHTGEWEEKNIGLYHHRLSIIDLSPSSNQPYNSSDKHVLTYNGEIYNYNELKLSKSPIQDSDTQSLYQLLIDEGENGFDKLNGIFAFGFLDTNNNRLLLARDRLGVKPLYYVDTTEYFAFASEAKVLYDYLDAFQLNWTAVHEYFVHGSVISNNNFVSGVKKLPPGSFLELNYSSYNFEIKPYWSVKDNIINSQPSAQVSYETAKAETTKRLEEGVKRQCRSDVNVGAYLSGGIDSSLVVAMASKYTDNPLYTFSAKFEGGDHSELPLAKQIADKYKTIHTEFNITTRNIEADIKKIVFQYDDPFADPAAIPLHLMAQYCSKDIRVVLQGDGGDELFAGYGRHLDAREQTLRSIAYPIASVLKTNKSARKSFKRRGQAINAKNKWEKAAYMVTGFPEENICAFFKDPYKDSISSTPAYSPYKEKVNELEHLDLLQTLLYTDMQIILPYTFMEKVDKINMMHHIEARVPLLDNEVVNYVMQLPGKYKIRKRTTKYLLRDIARDYVPDEVLNARKRCFGTPLSEWLRTILYDYVKEVFRNSRNLAFNPLDIDMLFDYLDLHKNRKVEGSKILWRSAVFLIWLDIYQNKLEHLEESHPSAMAELMAPSISATNGM